MRLLCNDISDLRELFNIANKENDNETIKDCILKSEEILEDKNSNNFYIMSKLNSLLNIRTKQPAFHPNATQFTLNLGDEVFGLWRQDKKRKQSIFSIYNVTSKSVKLSLQKINLIETEKWIDLISGEALKDIDDDILLKPYQSLWISNYNSEK